jgi:predicted NAD-dependent protein-ADP-ribosyltransferase YbiA (DUF1768 family)
MEITLYHKFAQHENLRQVLLATGEAELIVRISTFFRVCN